MKRTTLYDQHAALGAKFVEFCEWEMPLQYRGIIHEHQAVRTRVGLFDVSHMGRIAIGELEAEALLDYLSTNQIAGKADGAATYTVWCREDGTAVDDLIVYRLQSEKFFIVVNACNRKKDLEHLLHYSVGRDVIIDPKFDEEGILALQGPNALELASLLFPKIKNIKPMHVVNADYRGTQILIATTGYTGAGGVEFYVPNTIIADLWQELLDKGKAFGIEPAGLGARDTLRLEMGYALYGHELSDSIMPIESVSAWTVKWNKSNFVGKKAMEELEKMKRKRHQYGIVLEGEGVARQGYSILYHGHPIGVVTSGMHSPTLKKSIAIIMVERNLQVGDTVEVQIRKNRCPAVIAALPFIGTVRK